MHFLPPRGSEIRESFQVRDLVAIATGEEEPLTLDEALSSAKRTFERYEPGSIVRVFYIVREDDNRLSLISVSENNDWKREWMFGPKTVH